MKLPPIHHKITIFRQAAGINEQAEGIRYQVHRHYYDPYRIVYFSEWDHWISPGDSLNPRNWSQSDIRLGSKYRNSSLFIRSNTENSNCHNIPAQTRSENQTWSSL